MADTTSERPTYASNFIKGDWDKAVYLQNPHVDNLMTAFLGLGAEFWAMRRRMMVLEAMLAKGKAIDLAALEAYQPSAEQKVAWEAERDDFIKRTFSVLTRETTAQASAVPTDMTPPRNKM